MKKPPCKHCLGTGRAQPRNRNPWVAYHYMRENWKDLKTLSPVQILDLLLEKRVYSGSGKYNYADRLMSVEGYVHRLNNMRGLK